MLKRTYLFAVTLLCGLSLGLLTIPAAHAANTVMTAQVSSDPVVVGWEDTSQGITRDENLEQAIHDLFADATFAIQGNNGLVIADASGKPFLTAACVGDPTQFATFQGLNGGVNVVGDFIANPNDASEALVVMWASWLSKDGKTFYSPMIQLNLTVGGDGGGGNGGGGNSLGGAKA